MNRKFLVLFFLGVLLLAPVMSHGQSKEAGTKEEAVAMVKKAIDYIKANGRDKSFAEFTDLKGKFIDRDLYIVVYDMTGKCLAHGQKKSMVGQELIEFKDVDGKEYMKERMDLMKKNQTAWQEFKFMNPVSKKVEPKMMYLEKFEDVIVGCGVYKAS